MRFSTVHLSEFLVYLPESVGVPSAPVAAEFTRANRAELARSHPAFVMDGLSLYNPALAMDRYADLQPWLAQYHEVARTRTIVIYRVQ